MNFQNWHKINDQNLRGSVPRSRLVGSGDMTAEKVRVRKSKMTGHPASSRPFHRRKSRSHDCPLGSHTPTQSGQFRASEVTNLSHRIAKHSPSNSFGKPHRLATTPRLAGSRREFLKLLIPRNLPKRRLLQVSDLYRGFESFLLRHAVWTAEKVGSSTSEIRDNCPYFASILDKPDCGERTARQRMHSCCCFSLEVTRAVRFPSGHSANAMR